MLPGGGRFCPGLSQKCNFLLSIIILINDACLMMVTHRLYPCEYSSVIVLLRPYTSDNVRRLNQEPFSVALVRSPRHIL